jgi:hypothetical protein
METSPSSQDFLTHSRNSSLLMIPSIHYNALKRSPLAFVQMNPMYTPSYFCIINFNSIIPSKSRASYCSLSSRFSYQTMPSCPMLAKCPVISSFLRDHSGNVWRGVQFMKLFSVQLSPPYYFIPLKSDKYLTQLELSCDITGNIATEVLLSNRCREQNDDCVLRCFARGRQ